VRQRSLLIIAIILLLAPGTAAAKSARIGYLTAYYPWIAAIADGKFETATGYQIEWKRYETGADIVNALRTNEIDLGSVGSPPLAAALSLGHKIELFWILQSFSFTESLVVRKGSRIVKPQDLRGRRIAVPFASTSHYHLLFALSQFRIGLEDVRLFYSTPAQIREQWADRRIDAAFVWNPVHDHLLRTGKVIITSGRLSRWGKPIFDGLVVDREWARVHQSFMVSFVETIAAQDRDYRENRKEWDQHSKNIQKLIDFLGGTKFSAYKSLRSTKYPKLSDQISKSWLGGGANALAVLALEDTAKFLKEHGVIKSTLNSYADGVNPHWARQAHNRKGR